VGAVQVLAKWQEQGHKALLFTQTQQMLDILERHINDAGFLYHRMDGSVPLPSRFRMIDDFNNNPDIFVFLLTTRVGGLGVNLTGADRILLFDPDWNPATDIQARERAWRLGQKRPVTIFRQAPVTCDCLIYGL
jgi:DNA excision repair protein ERCC-6